MTPGHTAPNAMAAPANTRAAGAERVARIATRRAFVAMKQSYLAAVADIGGGTGELLQHKVRNADEPWELYSLRAVILASLPAVHPRAAEHRRNLQGELDSIFDRHER